MPPATPRRLCCHPVSPLIPLSSSPPCSHHPILFPTLLSSPYPHPHPALITLFSPPPCSHHPILIASPVTAPFPSAPIQTLCCFFCSLHPPPLLCLPFPPPPRLLPCQALCLVNSAFDLDPMKLDGAILHQLVEAVCSVLQGQNAHFDWSSSMFDRSN